MVTDTGQVFRLEDYRPTDYLIPETSLTFRLDPERTRVVSELTVERRDGIDVTTPLVLDGDGLELVSLEIDGQRTNLDEVEISPERLVLKGPPTARRFKLRIETQVSPAANLALMGLYRSNGIYCTQCEAEGFRRITYFLDRPDLLSVYTVRIEADRRTAPLLLSNGNPVEAGDLDGDRHYAIWHDPHPKPSYLFALVAGDLGSVRDAFVTASGRKVDLAIHVEHGKEARATYAMHALKRSMRWDEEVFGREYDLDVFNIVAVSDFNMGAMENKGLNIFNDKYVLADEETATDADYANIEAIIAHEYFHNWTGNRITCRDWFQLCLKEGLTVFRDQEFSADMRSRPVKRIADVIRLRAEQFPEDAGPLAHPVRPESYIEINNFYTPTVYEKGAEIVRMMSVLLGRERFRAAMDLYFERHDGEAATVEDFVRCMEDASGLDLGQFRRWYSQAGTPEITVSSRYSSARKTLDLSITQLCAPSPGQRKKDPYHFPLAIGLIGPDGRDIVPHLEGSGPTAVIEVREREHKFRFVDVPKRPILSVNRGFSSPVRVNAGLREADLLFLMTHDRDPFNRWEAGQSYATRVLIAMTEAVRAGRAPRQGAKLAQALGRSLDDADLDPAFVALMITLPGEADLAREVARDVDPGAIHAAREHLRRAVAAQLREPLTRAYARF